jgi:hypothetical protein
MMAAADREFRLAMLQSTDTCKKKQAGCAGEGKRMDVADDVIARCLMHCRSAPACGRNRA